MRGLHTALQISRFGFLVLLSPTEPLRKAIKSAGSSSLCPAVLMECGGLRMSYFPCLMLIISLLSVARRLTPKELRSSGDHVSARLSGVAEDNMQLLRSRSC